MDGAAYRASHRVVSRRGIKVPVFVGIMPWGDWMLLRPAMMSVEDKKAGVTRHIRFPMGSLFRANAELERRTEGKTSHMFAPDLYELQRMGKHAVRRFGFGTNEQGTESASLRGTIAVSRSFVGYALDTGSYGPEERAAYEALMKQLVASQVAVRDPLKVTAREQFSRGLLLTDRHNRRNPLACAMRIGSGIGHTLARSAQAAEISLILDRKTLYVYEYIQRHMELYQELWDEMRLTPRDGKKRRLLQLLDECEAMRGDASQHQRYQRKWLSIEVYLTPFLSAFHRVIARPFSRNAHHMRRDLHEAIELAHAEDAPGLRRQMAKIRQGASWVFVLHFLQRSVLDHFCALLERLHRQASQKRRGTGQLGRLIIDRSVAEKEFAEIDRCVAEFIARVERRCVDDDLKVRIKAPMLAHARKAQELLAAQDWNGAKRALKSAAALL